RRGTHGSGLLSTTGGDRARRIAARPIARQALRLLSTMGGDRARRIAARPIARQTAIGRILVDKPVREDLPVFAFPRIVPYRTHVVGSGAPAVRLDAHELVLERPVGVDLEINLAPHPVFRGEVTFSTFRGCNIVVEAQAANMLYL